jgi:hypothetical protein
MNWSRADWRTRTLLPMSRYGSFLAWQSRCRVFLLMRRQASTSLDVKSLSVGRTCLWDMGRKHSYECPHPLFGWDVRLPALLSCGSRRKAYSVFPRNTLSSALLYIFLTRLVYTHFPKSQVKSLEIFDGHLGSAGGGVAVLILALAAAVITQ